MPYLASGSVDNALLDLLNSSYPTQPHSLIALLFIQNNSWFKNIARTCLPAHLKFHLVAAIGSEHWVPTIKFNQSVNSFQDDRVKRLYKVDALTESK